MLLILPLSSARGGVFFPDRPADAKRVTLRKLATAGDTSGIFSRPPVALRTVPDMLQKRRLLHDGRCKTLSWLKKNIFYTSSRDDIAGMLFFVSFFTFFFLVFPRFKPSRT